MAGKAEARAAASRLRDRFAARGAEPVEADILLPAATLLDLYGEDIRARAFVTADPLRGEAVLRPDFTVPVVQMHLARGNGPARYTYAGEVFRKQAEGSQRPSEYMQAGYEVFEAGDPAAADAEVFAAVHEILAPQGFVPATGDMGLLRAAVDGLSTGPARKAALLRHLWHPRRFRALVERFSAPRPVPEPAGRGAAAIGLRSRAEVDERLAALAEDAAAPPLDAGEAQALAALLSLAAPAGDALPALHRLGLPALAPAIVRLEARLAALEAAGIAAAALPFKASYGRTTLEYYDGFVFGFTRPGAGAGTPPVAAGGRYDALTRALGGTTPSVGAALRPGLLLDLGGRA